MNHYRIAVLVSGRGSNLQALIEANQRGELSAQLVVVISNTPTAQALERAHHSGIPTQVIERQTGQSKKDYETRLIQSLESHRVDLIVLAGFMLLLSPYFVEHFKGRIINIHPSLLPAFPGLHAQRQAIAYGARFSGCTVHFVDEGCDTGPIILQTVIPVFDEDTEQSLSARILREEHLLLPKAIDLLSKNKVQRRGRRVVITDPAR